MISRLKCGRSVECGYAAVYHYRHTVAVFRLIKVVCRDEDRHSFRRCLIDEFPEFAACYGVYTSRRLIEEDDFWRMDGGGGERELLAPSYRNGFHPGIGHPFHIEPLHDVVHTAFYLAVGQPVDCGEEA